MAPSADLFIIAVTVVPVSAFHIAASQGISSPTGTPVVFIGLPLSHYSMMWWRGKVKTLHRFSVDPKRTIQRSSSVRPARVRPARMLTRAVAWKARTEIRAWRRKWLIDPQNQRYGWYRKWGKVTVSDVTGKTK